MESIMLSYPVIGGILAAIAVIIMVLRWAAPKTGTDIDDKIVDYADKTGVSKFLEKFNPFRKK